MEKIDRLKYKMENREKEVITEKYCKKCKETKFVMDFSKDKNSKDLYAFYCKDCYKELSNEQYQNRKAMMFTKLISR